MANIISDAGDEMNPSLIANYVFNLAKLYNSFYTEHSVANAETDEKKQLRLAISVMTCRSYKKRVATFGN